MRNPIEKIIGVIFIIIAAVLVVRAEYKDARSTDVYARSKVVHLVSESGSCSGVVVEGSKAKTYILTAGHCSMLKDKRGKITVVRENLTRYSARIIAIDDQSDLMLLESQEDGDGIRIRKESLRLYEKVHTMTHGGGRPIYRTDGEALKNDVVAFISSFILSEKDRKECDNKPSHFSAPTLFGEVCVVSYEELVTTARVVPGSSGGPLLDEAGNLVGIVSATDDSYLFSYMVTLKDIHEFMADR